MSNLIKIVYVGKKPIAYDNVAGSGKSWAGHGDVQEVTEAQAKKLLKFPDQWQLADAADVEALDAPVSTEVTGENGESVQVDNADLKKPLEKMNKTELTALAKQTWDKDLDPAMTKKAMIDQIEEWQHELGA